jgi:branched-chain amino acid transport system permease protein
MTDFVVAYLPLVNLVILNCGLALSQYAVLRAGVFSLATAGLASIGAYTAGILNLRAGVPALVAVLGGALSAMIAALILSLPLARLRGVFQAIATVAMVQIILSVALYADDITGGANGLNGIPRLVGTPALVLFIGICIYGLWCLGRGRVGAAFDTIRQDETVAVSLGISVGRYQALAFALSGIIAGATGALMACHNHSVVPEEFGFDMLTTVLAYVVLGGRQSVAGPIVGAVVLSLLPEIARPLADNRMILLGALIMLAIIYLPHGIVDSIVIARRRAASAPGAHASVPEAADGRA